MMGKQMKKSLSYLPLLFVAVPSMAQTLPDTTNVPTDLPAVLPHETIDWAVMPTPHAQTPIAEMVSVQSVGESAEDQIGQMVVEARWDELLVALAEYRMRDGHDAVLYDYAMGAMLRAQGRHTQAISHYERITADASMVFPRFDLAVMYFENKQYRDAARTFHQVREQLPEPMQALVDRYLSAIRTAQKVDVDFGLNFERTDNVNNASDLSEIVIGGATFVRTADSLPQSATGLRYDVGVSRELSVGGRHHLYGSVSADGIYYWDNQDYNETNLQAQLGYRHKTARTTWSLTPFVGESLFSDARYTTQYGTSGSVSHRYNDKWQLYINGAHSRKSYHDDALAARYDGHANDALMMAMYQPNQHWLYYAGIEARRERLLDASESSNRQGYRLGATYINDQFGVQAVYRQTTRKFLAPNFWYGQVRDDKESQLSASVWLNRLNYRGFVPKLNYRILRTDSNLDLYDRDSKAWFVTIDKMF